MKRIELGCLFCSKYSLVTPIHGYGDAPYYKCNDGRNPKECEICKHNANKSCVKGGHHATEKGQITENNLQ